MEVQKFCLNDIKGPVCTTWKATIPQFSTVSVHANSSVKGYCMWVHVLMELMPGPQLSAAVVLTVTYGEFHLDPQGYLSACTTWVPVPWKFPQKLWLDRLPLPTKYHQKSTQPGLPKSHNKLQKGWVLEALALQCFQEWPESEQKQARELLLKWEHLFAHSNLDLGKTALIKHKIDLTDWMPSEECYWWIPPDMYDDMRAHIQEMLDIGTIYKLHSPWASVVVLVWKKDIGLRFCIDLRNLNNQTVKDAYSLPSIDETLDSLQSSQWFSSLNLKLG